MARKPTSISGHGHNSGDLTDDEKAALLHRHLITIRKAQKAADIVKATYDAARTEVNDAFAACKGDLSYNRKQLTELLEALAQSEVAFRLNENARRERFSLAGLPMGGQLDMFATDTVGDREAARADGYRAGLRADDMEVPDNIATMFRGDWEDAWRDGQAENLRKFAIANGVDEAHKAGSNEPELEEDDRDDDEVIDDAAAKLKREGWTKPAEAETAFAEPAAAAELETA